MAGQQDIDEGYRVYFLFVFTDCSKIMELKADSEFKCKFTGSNCIKHYLIPVAGLLDFDPDNDEFVAIEPELESEEDMIEIN